MFAPAPFFFHAASVHVSEAVAGRHTPAEYSKGALAAVVVAVPDAPSPLNLKYTTLPVSSPATDARAIPSSPTVAEAVPATDSNEGSADHSSVASAPGSAKPNSPRGAETVTVPSSSSAAVIENGASGSDVSPPAVQISIFAIS